MADVVKFSPEAKISPAPVEDLIWCCAECECVSFKLHVSNVIECASCGNTGPSGEWIKELPEPAAEPEERYVDANVVSMNGSPRSALRKFARDSDTDNLLALVSIQENGRVQAWGGIENPMRVGWLHARLEDAYKLLTMYLPKSSLVLSPEPEDDAGGAA